jgi:4-amino-4-deoxy-L-arabinose transferase-like glycosyltransferase
MFEQLRQCLAAHPRWTLGLLVAVMLGPFLAKPFNIDDPLFIWQAQHVQAHPANPFGYEVNWYGAVQSMATVATNPPLAGYYFALTGGVFGWSEISLHCAGWLAALAVILGTHRLASRLCEHPLLAACAVLSSPIFLVSANTVMCDVLMLAFWVWAVACWVEGLEQNSYSKIFFAGLLVALALLTKYFGAMLIPLLAAHGALQKRKLGGWVLGLLVPIAALGLFQWLMSALYGHNIFSDSAGFVANARGQLGFSKPASAVIALAFAGGGAASAVLLAPWLWRVRTAAIVFCLAAVAAGLLWFTGGLMQKYPALEGVAHAEVGWQLIFWAGAGALVLSLAVDVLLQPRDACAWLLTLWLAGTFAFAAFGNWIVNGRSILPMLPAVGILLARRWQFSGQKNPRAIRTVLAASAIFALFVAFSDFQLAVAVRRCARESMAQYGQGGRVWFEGHWGFQYYMDKLGARAVDYNTFKQTAGEILVVPLNNTQTLFPPEDIIASRDNVSVAGPTGLTTWQRTLGAGFYSSVSGPLPFAFGDAPAESVVVYQWKTAN